MFATMTRNLRSWKIASTASRRPCRASLDVELMEGRQLLSIGMMHHHALMAQSLVQNQGSSNHHHRHANSLGSSGQLRLHRNAAKAGNAIGPGGQNLFPQQLGGTVTPQTKITFGAPQATLASPSASAPPASVAPPSTPGGSTTSTPVQPTTIAPAPTDVTPAPGTQTQVTRLIESSPSGPLTPSSHITMGL